MTTPRQVAVGVLADEGLPEQVITTIADDLPEIFAARVSGQMRWRVEHEVDQLPLDENGDIPMRTLSQRHRHLNLVWLCSSVGIVAGALGSSLEDEETVRNATYSRRERERKNAPGAGGKTGLDGQINRTPGAAMSLTRDIEPSRHLGFGGGARTGHRPDPVPRQLLRDGNAAFWNPDDIDLTRDEADFATLSPASGA